MLKWGFCRPWNVRSGQDNCFFGPWNAFGQIGGPRNCVPSYFNPWLYPPLTLQLSFPTRPILSDKWENIHWPSFGKGENKGSVLLWYSCFGRSILMFLMRERLECHIIILKNCMMRLWNDSNQLTLLFPFAETRSIKRIWRQLTDRITEDFRSIGAVCVGGVVLYRWIQVLLTTDSPKDFKTIHTVPKQHPIVDYKKKYGSGTVLL